MTLTWPGGLVPDQTQPQDWQPLVSSRAPGFAVAVPMTDRLRLVVLDLADRGRPGAEVLRAVNPPDAALDAAGLADRLVAPDLGRSRCSSVAIADLFPAGTLDLQLRNAPSAVLLRPGLPALLLPGATLGDRSDRMAPGEVLLLCSATFLEAPPAVLGTVRRPPADDAALVRLRRALGAAPHRGATASVASPSR